MQLTIDEKIFELFPDFSAGVVAIKGIDNLTQDSDIEAFLRHASLEAGLLLKLRPIDNDASILAYRDALCRIGAEEAVSSAEKTIRRFEKGLASAMEGNGAGFTPGAMTGLEGALALSRENPVMDLIHGTELQFRLPALAFDVGRKEWPVSIREEEGDIVCAVGEEVSVRHFFCDEEAAGRVDEETRNLLIVLPCFSVNRRKAMSVRNELARRLKDSFGRTSEAAWLAKEEREFISKI